nr:metallophosphoesterase [uncultured Draconibacterium sp.]
MKQINWIHITDLHVGVSGYDILFPKLKHEFEKDLILMIRKLGKIDIVFFTGDITQAGKKEEFDQANVYINELWKIFKKYNSNPILVCVPGNHDLERPDKNRAVAKLIRDYHKDKENRELFWQDGDNECMDLIESSFSNYTNWYKSLEIPTPKEIKHGLMPGDFSCNLEINNINIGILGLNTSFIQISEGDYEGKIEFGLKQLKHCFDNELFSWKAKNDISILLSHHSYGWFSEDSQKFYKSDLNPENTFYNHFCGHLHIPESTIEGAIGSELRRQQIAPSLFGLEFFNDTVERVHGYNLGSYSFNNDILNEKFYPRILTKKYDGNLKIAPDQGYDLSEENCCNISTKIERSSEDTKKRNEESSNIEEIKDKPRISFNEDILHNDKLNEEDFALKNSIPRISLTHAKQHEFIRIAERNTFENKIQKERFIWISTSWGLDEESFISCALSQIPISKEIVYRINCEDISNTQGYIGAFQDQFNISIQRFCKIVAGQNKSSILIFDQISPSIYRQGNSLQKFNEFVSTILDYCSNLTIIATIWQSHPEYLKEVLELKPLDLAQVRAYIINHPLFSEEYDNTVVIEKLHAITSGLPKHLNNILNKLKFASLEEIFEEELDNFQTFIEDHTLPQVLVQSIHVLANSPDTYKRRSFEMLKLLSILKHGETLKTLKQINSTEPFYPANALELEQLSLLESTIVPTLIPKFSNSASEYQSIKILRLPREVRDYVYSIIPENERIEIVKKACDIYFGNKWRSGVIRKIKKSTIDGKVDLVNFENYHTITILLLKFAIDKNNDLEIERAANICINLSNKLNRNGDFKDALALAEDSYYLIKKTKLETQKAQIFSTYGESLRMAGDKSDKSKVISLLKEALSLGESYFSKADKADIYTEIAFCYETMPGEEEKVVEFAKKIQEITEKDTSKYITAQALIIENTLDSELISKRLKSLESKARKLGFEQSANNIALSISKLDEYSNNDKERYLDKVILSSTEYTKVRAIVGKAEVLCSEKNFKKFTPEFQLQLSLSYTYLYFQRIPNLFNKCHKTLWSFLIEKSKITELLNMYRHSSFVWRIHGKTELDLEYVNKLKSIEEQIFSLDDANENKINKEYYKRRKKEFGL